MKIQLRNLFNNMMYMPKSFKELNKQFVDMLFIVGTIFLMIKKK